MPTKAVYLLVVPGFADWEPAHALAELRRYGRYRVEVVGLTSTPVESMGGLTIQPNRTISEVDSADVAVFILPGGDRWETTPIEPELEALLKKLDAAGVPLGAICAATVVIAKMGLLRGRRHTSNARAYVEHYFPGYDEGANYVDLPAVRDRGLITASGLADVEFAAELMGELEVLTDKRRSLWTRMFRSGRVPEQTLGAQSL